MLVGGHESGPGAHHPNVHSYGWAGTPGRPRYCHPHWYLLISSFSNSWMPLNNSPILMLSLVFTLRHSVNAEELHSTVCFSGLWRCSYQQSLWGVAGPTCPRWPRSTPQAETGQLLALIFSRGQWRWSLSRSVFREAGQGLLHALPGLSICA